MFRKITGDVNSDWDHSSNGSEAQSTISRWKLQIELKNIFKKSKNQVMFLHMTE